MDRDVLNLPCCDSSEISVVKSGLKHQSGGLKPIGNRQRNANVLVLAVETNQNRKK